MPSAPLTPGTVIDRYRIEAVIGEGGMATVYRVRHLALDSVHALKVLHVISRSIRDRMRQEGQFQARLSHPNIVAVTDVIQVSEESPGLIMEHVDGPTLEQLLQERGPLPLPLVDALASGIFAGVSEAHRQGLVHRDLKPSNVLLQPAGDGFLPKVTDFGLAKMTATPEGTQSRTRTGTSMGTPYYMSPEQVRDSKHVAPSSDLFALGAILYEMVAGVRAFDGTDLLEVYNAVAHAAYDPVSRRRPGVPARMERAIAAALQIDPALRPPSVEALAAIWRGEATSQPPTSFSRSASAEPLPSRATWMVGGVAILGMGGAGAALAVAFLAYWLFSGPAAPPPTPAPPPLAESPTIELPEILVEPLPEPAPEPGPAPAGPAMPSAELLARSTRPADRRKAVTILASSDDSDSLLWLERLARPSEEVRDVRSAAVRALVNRYLDSAGREAANHVISLSADPDPGYAAIATRALGRYADDPRVLLAPLSHGSPEVRMAAVDALAPVVGRATREVDLGPIRRKLAKESSSQVKGRIALLPETLRPR